MNDNISTENYKYENKDFSKIRLPIGDYENCEFINCNFANSDLSEINFIECVFQNCDLSMSNISETAFRNVKFINCKLLGLHFEECNNFLFAANFTDTQLNYSSFHNCNFIDVDLTEADLSGSIFDDSDFSGAIFNRTKLMNTDFKTSYNFTIDPEINNIKNAKFSITNVSGLLDKYDIKIE